MITVRPFHPAERAWVRRTVADLWGVDVVVAHGEAYRPHQLPGFVAELDGERAGLLCYSVRQSACEIVALASLQEGQGIGSALIDAMIEEARRLVCSRVWLITTNDNLNALRFYQKRGFRLVALHPGAVTAARALKPEIPAIGDHGIPLRDELEFELSALDRRQT